MSGSLTTVEDWKIYIIQSLTYRTYDEYGQKYPFMPYLHGHYWSSPDMKMAELRDAALAELEGEGRMKRVGKPTPLGFQEWQLI